MEIRSGSPNYRVKCLKQKLPLCNVCGHGRYIRDLVVHHIDGDGENNDLDNLIPLCRSCHAKVHNKLSYGGRLDELSEELGGMYAELPDEVCDVARKVRDERGFKNIGRAIQAVCQEGGYDV